VTAPKVPKGMSSTGKIRTNFWFEQSQLDQLKATKERTGIPVSELIRMAVDAMLKKGVVV
jgi:hypothetical protein